MKQPSRLVLMFLTTALPLTGAVAADSSRDDPAPGETEVRRVVPLRDQDMRVLRSLHAMPVERLSELLRVYEKVGDTGMVEALSRAILERDPKNEEALNARNQTDAPDPKRDAAYLEALTSKVLKGEVVEDTDGVSMQASVLLEKGEAAESVRLLETLRRNQFPDATFPYLDDLAQAYGETGQYELAAAANKAIIADPDSTDQARDEAREALKGVEIKLRIADLRRDAGGDNAALVAGAEKLHAEFPNDYDVTTFHVEALDHAGRHGEVIEMLKKMQASWTGKSTWPFLPTLAYAYYEAKQYPQAIATFRAVEQATDLEASSRLEAENMILEIKVASLIERGNAALDNGHLAEARQILDQLERDYHTQADVMGFKAMYLTKTGRSDEALALLNAEKREADKEHLPFPQQDLIADVYIERKQFNFARDATLEIIYDNRYSEEFRGEAVKKLQEIRVAELLDIGYKDLEDANRGKARRVERELETLAPEDLEVRIFEAEVALAYGHDNEARDQLLEYKAKRGDLAFSGQNALGSALAKTGRWEDAYAAYGEVIDNPGYSLEDQWEARNEKRSLAPWIMPTVRVETHFEHSREGDLLMTDSQYSSRWYNDWRFAAFVHSDSTKLSSSDVFGSRRDSRFEGGISAMHRFDDGYFAEASVGASQDKPLYGVRVGRLAYESLGWSLGFSGNARATDSTTLQALDGRADRIYFKAGGALTDRLMLDLDAYYQRVSVGGSGIGKSYGIEGSVDYVVQTETRTRPEILVGYHGEYRRFDAASTMPPAVRDQIKRAEMPVAEVRRALGNTEEVRRANPSDFGHEVLETLIDPATDRHGLELKIRKHFNTRWSTSAEFGTYYALDDDTVGWDASVSLEYWINDATMLFAELRYDSDGKGASAGSGVWEASLGGSVSF